MKFTSLLCSGSIDLPSCSVRWPSGFQWIRNPTASRIALRWSDLVRRREDLPQKALFRAKPNEGKNQGRPKSRWANVVNSDSLVLGPGQILDALCSRQAVMERSSSTCLNQVLVVVSHK
jgi:hypothetical protein